MQVRQLFLGSEKIIDKVPTSFFIPGKLLDVAFVVLSRSRLSFVAELEKVGKCGII